MEIGQGRTITNYKGSALGALIGSVFILFPLLVLIIPIVLVEIIVQLLLLPDNELKLMG